MASSRRSLPLGWCRGLYDAPTQLRNDRRSDMSKAEELFAELLRSWGCDGFVREYQFHPSRRWRFDFAWPHIKLAVELHGGVYGYHPSHTSAKRLHAEYEKLNEAQINGWTVLQIPTIMLSPSRHHDVQALIIRAGLEQHARTSRTKQARKVKLPTSQTSKQPASKGV